MRARARYTAASFAKGSSMSGSASLHPATTPRPTRAGGNRARTFAAIDLGTNTCRLLVARAPRVRERGQKDSSGGFRVVDAFSRIVRLGDCLTDGAEPVVLSHTAMRRTIDALKVCAGKLARHRPDRMRAVATEACRRAENHRAFFRQVADETGIDLEVIGPEEEATLALRGCAPLLEADRSYALVFDIGGGSTQVSFADLSGQRAADKMEVTDAISVPFGVVGMAARLGRERVAEADYRAMVDDIADALSAFCKRNALSQRVAGGAVQMIGTSGTVTTLAGVHLGLPRYDRRRVDGTFVSADDLRAISDRLAAMDARERATVPCIGRDRADLVVAGCGILAGMLARWPVDRVRVADRGVREGILATMMADAAS